MFVSLFKRVYSELRAHSLFSISLVVGAFFLFYGLSNTAVAGDEIGSAMLADVILKYGLPYGFDELRPFEVRAGSINEDGLVIIHTWFFLYYLAFFLGVFGKSYFFIRVGFALFGFLTIILTYFLAKKLFRDENTAGLSCLFVATNVSYLVDMRLAGYYALAAFFSLLLVFSYLQFLERKRFSRFFFVFSAVFLFHAGNPVSFFVAVFVLSTYHFVKHRSRMREFLLLLVVAAAILLPFFLYTKMWQNYFPLPVESYKFPFVIGYDYPRLGFFRTFSYYVITLSAFVFPVLLLAVWFLFPPDSFKRLFFSIVFVLLLNSLLVFFPLIGTVVSLFLFLFVLLRVKHKEHLFFSVLFIFLSVFLWSLFPRTRELRYLLPLIPFVFMLVSFLLQSSAIKYKKAIAAVFMLTSIGFYATLFPAGALFHATAVDPEGHSVSSITIAAVPLFSFFNEISFDSHQDDVPRLICETVLKVHGKPFETVKMSSLGYIIKFYCPEFLTNEDTPWACSEGKVTNYTDWYVVSSTDLPVIDGSNLSFGVINNESLASGIVGYDYFGRTPFYEFNDLIYGSDPWVHSFSKAAFVKRNLFIFKRNHGGGPVCEPRLGKYLI